MDPQAKIIPLHLHPLGFIEAFTALGADLDLLLRDTQIDKAALRQGRGYISYHQQTTLIRNGAVQCGAGTGLQVGMLFDWLYFGTVGGVVHCSPTLRDAGEAFRRYTMLAQPYYATSGRTPGGYVDEHGVYMYALRCFPPAAQQPTPSLFEIEFRLATVLRIWDACGNKSVANPAVRVGLAYPEPAHAQLYRQLPCASVQFNCAQSYLAAHKSFLIEPFRLYRKPAFERLVERCEQELTAAQLETSMTAKVRWHVYAYFNKPVTLDEIAAQLHMTPRALTRRLTVEGTTFRQILHDVRMELTSHHLRFSKLSVDELSDLMGFSNASSLRRAIRKWTGSAAGTVRQAPMEHVASYL
jgi:AraC-like DNA-binding protein